MFAKLDAQLNKYLKWASSHDQKLEATIERTQTELAEHREETSQALRIQQRIRELTA